MRSAGLLPFRRLDGLEVLAAHPGGPFWANKEEGAWSVVKGLVEENEDPMAAAGREFLEETGWVAPSQPWIDLGEVRLRSGKRVIGWAVEADYDPETLRPGTCVVRWKGRHLTVPEIDRVAWLGPDTARVKLNPAYGDFLDRLERALDGNG